MGVYVRPQADFENISYSFVYEKSRGKDVYGELWVTLNAGKVVEMGDMNPKNSEVTRIPHLFICSVSASLLKYG